MAEDTLGSDLTLRADIGDGLLAPADMFFGYVPATVEDPGNKNFRVDGYGITSMIGRTINTVKQSQQIDAVGAAASRAYLISVDTGYSAYWQVLIGGVIRWGWGRASTGEWALRRYDTTGTLQDSPISVDAATGVVTMVQSPVISGVGAASSRTLMFNTDAGYSGSIQFRTAGLLRWALSKNTSGESGANAGSNIQIARYDDTGASLGTPFSITRSSGLTTIAEGLAVSGAGGAASGFTSLGVASTTTTAPVNIDSIAGQFAITRYRTGSLTRWDAGKETTAESGSNAGSDYTIRAFTDAGNLRATTLKISRANGDISFEGNLIPTSDNAKSLGTGSFRMSVIYAGTGTINTSDERAKQDVGQIPDALLDAWGSVEWRQYRFIDSFNRKGDDARWHFGLIAQQVRDAIDAALGEGSAIRLGLVCHDEWEAKPAQFVPEMHFITRQKPGVKVEHELRRVIEKQPRPVVVEVGQDEAGNPITRELLEMVDVEVEQIVDIEVEIMIDVEVEEPTGNMIEVAPAIEAGDRWGLRYDECFALEAAWQRRRMDLIEATLATLAA